MANIKQLGEQLSLESSAMMLLQVPTGQQNLGEQLAQEIQASEDNCEPIICTEPVHPYYISYFVSRVCSCQKAGKKPIIILEQVHRQRELSKMLTSLESLEANKLVIIATTYGELGLERGFFSHRYKTDDGNSFDRIL